MSTMRSLLTQVICETFSNACGKHQMSKPAEERRAFQVTFRSPVNHNDEDGYRYLDLVLYAPMNYVEVWVRERWNVIPVEDLLYSEEDDDSSPRPGKDYTKGQSPWTRWSFHDSGWRDGVERVLKDKDPFITGFSGRSWYELVEPTKLELPQ